MKKDKKDNDKEMNNQYGGPGESEENKSEKESASLAEKDERIVKLEKEIAELKDRLLRKAAEFENYKRRTENDQLNLLKYAAESLILKLLPIIDDFERSMNHIESTEDIDSLKQGIKLIYDKFMKTLDEQGVKKIESVGQPFNVDFHEALMQRKSDDVPPHTVLDELEKGYMYKDRVIRHAKVIVSEDTGEYTPDSEDNDNKNTEE